MLTTYQQQAKLKLTASVVSIIVIAGLVIFTDHIKAKSPIVATSSQTTSATTASSTTPSTPTGSSTPASQPTTSPASSSSSSNTYSATSDYVVPHGSESIQVSLTIAGGVITDASIQNSENDPTSALFQEDFAAVYKSAVVGKKISGLQISTISGASDTTEGFNDALSQISAKV